MNIRTIEKEFNTFDYRISQGQNKLVLNQLNKYIKDFNLTDLTLDYDKLNEKYHYFLQYNLEHKTDPNRKKILDEISVSIMELCDNVKSQLISSVSLNIGNKKSETENSLISISDLLSYDHQLDENMPELFDKLWFTNKFEDKLCEQVIKTFQSENTENHEKSLLVSAVTMSLLRYFDPQKFHLLFNIYEQRQKQVWQRAAVGIILSLYIYQRRLPFFKNILFRLQSINEKYNFNKESEHIIIQLLKSKDTEKVTKKFQEEIMPEVLKIQPKLRDKLNLDKLIREENIEQDENPNWERVFEDSPNLLNKLQELSEMQLDGTDVFMGTFSMLKNFPFFDTISNWFQPFYEGNTVANEAFDNEETNFDKDKFIEGLAKSNYMCNSDKYSFCLNIKQMPSQPKQMMFSMLNQELDNMNEVAKNDELVNSELINNTIFTQYIQDLYRFFKLNPMKKDIIDPFNYRLEFYKSSISDLFFHDLYILRNLAEFYFSRQYFKQAAEVFEQLMEKGETGQELFEKTGYCYQKLGKYDLAIDHFKKAELFDQNHAWNLKKIAYCYRQLGEQLKALDFYLQAEKYQPENIVLLTNIGNCYLDTGEYEKALDYYFKIEYSDTSNENIWRPIAWCSFIAGKFDIANKYYEQLIEGTPNQYDLMNFGHLKLCMGNNTEAISLYRKSIRFEINTLENFLNGFNDDIQYLLKNGVNHDDIDLIKEYLLY